jgi:type III pantothenate kinase
MKLVLDIGNAFIKAGVFQRKHLLNSFTSTICNDEFLEMIFASHAIALSIVSSVREIPEEVLTFLNEHSRMIRFSLLTPIPVVNCYKSPATLGNDRLAGVVGAHALYPGENILVIDAGTCITCDFINAHSEYIGGSISPGLSMRFKALNTFTGKLPLVDITDYHELTGTDTTTSILSGVINGAVFEIDAMIAGYCSLYTPLRTLICGGDALFLAERLKSSTFAAPELVLTGLNEILDYNDL